MLAWKPAKNSDAVHQMQKAIVQNPNTIDWRQLHYYVTMDDMAEEIGKATGDITHPEVNEVLQGMGLNTEKDVYDLPMGFFVAEKTLKELEIPHPDWDVSRVTERGANA